MAPCVYLILCSSIKNKDDVMFNSRNLAIATSIRRKRNKILNENALSITTFYYINCMVEFRLVIILDVTNCMFAKD